MKMFSFMMAVAFSMLCTGLHAQNAVPNGFSKGSITLPGNTVVLGYIKDNLRSNGTLAIITTETDRKKNYGANDLLAAQIDSSRFISIQGDFFRVLSEGELYFLQKASNASSTPVYNGTEALFIKGTDGQVNDYFFYDRAKQQLQLLTKKNRQAMIAGTFTNCAAAIAKAGETGTDMAQLREAVDMYNHRSQQ